MVFSPCDQRTFNSLLAFITFDLYYIYTPLFNIVDQLCRQVTSPQRLNTWNFPPVNQKWSSLWDRSWNILVASINMSADTVITFLVFNIEVINLNLTVYLVWGEWCHNLLLLLQLVCCGVLWLVWPDRVCLRWGVPPPLHSDDSG